MKKTPAGLVIGLAAAALYIVLEHSLSIGALRIAPSHWYAPDHFWLLLAVAPALACLVVQALHTASPLLRLALLSLALTAAALSVGLQAQLLAHMHWYYWLQHAVINSALALYFGSSLRAGATPLCTRFAAVLYDELSPELMHYTRQVTRVWTGFFVAVTFVSSTLFFFGARELWSWFANVLYAPLLGAMFVGEYALRFILLPRESRGHWLDAVRGFSLYKARELHDRQLERAAAPAAQGE